LRFCSSTRWQLAAEPLKIGMELSYPPFETIDTEGQPAGFSVELAKALGAYLKRPIVIENIPFVGLIPSLKTGKIDLILSSLTVTPDREKAINFSDPYLETGLSLLLRIDSTISGIEELNTPGRIVAVKQGTTGEVYAKKEMTQAKVLILDKEASCVLEVIQGKVDAFIYDEFSIYTNWQKNKETTKPILKPFYKENWAMGLRKGDKKLLDEVNCFLEQFRKKNGIDKLTEKFFPGHTHRAVAENSSSGHKECF
jgi:polar amino acid transport system substrate-binding protein